MKTEHVIRSIKDLNSYALTLAKSFPSAFFLALHGELGVGKTAFVKSLGSLWGIKDIRSPSFDIMHVHDGLRRLIHIDAYRLNRNSLDAFALDDLCRPPFCLIVEWPECLSNGALNFHQHLYFSLLPDGSRRIISEIGA